MSFVGKSASVKKEGEMRADDNSKPLSEVPVPGVGTIEISHAMENVKLKEVKLNHDPLENREKDCRT